MPRFRIPEGFNKGHDLYNYGVLGNLSGLPRMQVKSYQVVIREGIRLNHLYQAHELFTLGPLVVPPTYTRDELNIRWTVWANNWSQRSSPESIAFHNLDWSALNNLPRKVKRLGFLGLSSISDKDHQLRSIRQHVAAYFISKKIQELANEKIYIWFDDPYYSEQDHNYIPTKFSDPNKFHVTVTALNDTATKEIPRGNDWMVVTFTPNNPYRQVLADPLTAYPMNTPLALICKRGTVGGGVDETTRKVDGWLSNYKTEPFTSSSSQTFSETHFHVLKQ